MAKLICDYSQISSGKEAADENTPLQEKDFIQEGKGKSPLPMWLFIFALLGVLASIWFGVSWLFQKTEERINKGVFLQVTNRQISLFLFQNPEYMRSHYQKKTGYLTSFHSAPKIGPKLELADKYAAAPPEILFKYHTWNRLLGDYVTPRAIVKEDFKEFLLSQPLWLPENWPKAPLGYKELVENLDLLEQENLQTFPESIFPKKVRLAFFGWKNYTQEGEKINQLKPTFEEVFKFLEKYPHYGRAFWRNLYPSYLKTFLHPPTDLKSAVASQEITPFLRVALYNASVSAKEEEP